MHAAFVNIVLETEDHANPEYIGSISELRYTLLFLVYALRAFKKEVEEKIRFISVHA